MPVEKYKNIENANNLKIFNSNEILIYNHDKLQNITYHFYRTEELKYIEYWNKNVTIINNKKGDSIGTKSKINDINQFLEKNYLEINSEDDKMIRDFTFTWIDELIRTEQKNAIIVLNDLIRSKNIGMKTHAIQKAALNQISDCLKNISLELDNKTKADIYRGPVWDEFEIQGIYTADTFSELAQIAIDMIKTKTKHNKELR